MDSVAKPSNAAESFARRRLATVPGFTPELAEAARLTRLVGMTNSVYAVEVGGSRFCLRIPGGGAAAKIDRREEERNARLAAEAGVAPEVLYFGADGVMLTRFVEDGIPLRPERIAASNGALDRAARTLRRLHDCPATFAGTFRAFATIDLYLAALSGYGTPLAETERDIVAKMQRIGAILTACPIEPKPCHCDPTGRNLLDTGETVWLVDWEYSAMNDPMWDLAYFSVESGLDAAGDAALLLAYFERAPGAKEAARMAVLKPVCEVLAALWALIQVAEGKTGGDFSGYARATFERAGERMRSAEFSRELSALAAP